MGQKVASEGVTIVDDGTIDNRRGSLTIDDEGYPNRKNSFNRKWNFKKILCKTG